MNKRARMERCVCEKQQRHYVLVHRLVLEHHSRTKRTKSKKKKENVYYIGANTTILLEKTMLLKRQDALLELDKVFVKATRLISHCFTKELKPPVLSAISFLPFLSPSSASSRRSAAGLLISSQVSEFALLRFMTEISAG